MTKSTQELEERLRGVFERHPEIVGAYLFGSRARGDEHEGSDVDVAVVFDGPADLERTVLLEVELEGQPASRWT